MSNNSDQWFYDLANALINNQFDEDGNLIIPNVEDAKEAIAEAKDSKDLEKRLKKNKNRSEVIRNPHYKAKRVSNMFIGEMISFYYPTPKTESSLPYFDETPQVILLKKYKGKSAGFLGFNISYMPKKERLKLLTLISGNRRSKKKGMGTIATMYRHPNYQFLFKRYLYSQLKSRVISIPQSDWQLVAELPVRWRKATHHKVSSDYRKAKRSR